MFIWLTEKARYWTNSESDTQVEEKLLCGAWIYLVLTLLGTYFAPAPYGKFKQTISTFQVSAPIGWVVQEIPSLLVSFLALIHFYQQGLFMKMIILSPYVLHYFNRSVIFPLQIEKGKPMPLLTVVLAFLFCAINGFLQSVSILNIETDRNIMLSLVGVLLFLVGLLANIHSDHLLRSLRKGGGSGYKIPRGGLFQLVSSPNYLGEALEWLGFAYVVQTQAAVWFATFTTLFLGARAVQTHAWYKEKFGGEYPEERKAFIPYIL